MTRYAVALGSNLGNRVGLLRTARDRIDDLGTVSAASALYETAPVGGPEQGAFLNALVLLESSLEPHQLLDALHEVEAEAGRERTTHWGPRTLDLDIVTMDSGELDSADLQIPHPRAAERGFVLRPLVDVWPDAPVGNGLTASEALDAVGDQGVDFLARDWKTDDPWPGRVLVTVQFVWLLLIGVVIATDGSLPAGDADLLRLLGLFLAVVGGALATLSSRRLGRALTAHPEPKQDVILIETGPYSRARHPIYGGVTLFVLGAAMLVDSLAGTLMSLALIPFFLVKSAYEEKRLRIRYAGYSGYLERVPRRLIPFII